MPSETSTGCADQSVEELRRELVEAREQQAATAEILKAISNSPSDLHRIFQEIATTAARLCEAYDASIGQMDGLAQNKKLALKSEVAKSLPIGLGDEQRLTQVLLNLVGNAIKFTDAGEVRVTAKAVNGRFNVSVADTGPGIPEEHKARIFDQFHQVDSSNTKAKGGTGLGLAIRQADRGNAWWAHLG
jgi:two-component system, NtrC family, sensor kinase